MLLRKIRTLARYRERLALQLSWRDYPALLTHGLAFLAGSLLIRVHQPQAFPAQKIIFFPLDRNDLPQGLWNEAEPLKHYVLIEKRKEGSCLLSEQSYRIWHSAVGKDRLYLMLEKTGESLRLLTTLTQNKKWSLVLAPFKGKLCQVSDADVSYDP